MKKKREERRRKNAENREEKTTKKNRTTTNCVCLFCSKKDQNKKNLGTKQLDKHEQLYSWYFSTCSTRALIQIWVTELMRISMGEREKKLVETFYEIKETRKRILIWFWLFLIRHDKTRIMRKGRQKGCFERELSSLTTQTLNVSWRTSKYVILSSSFSLHDKCLSPISIIFHLLHWFCFGARVEKNDTTQKSTLDCFCRRLFSCQLVALLIMTLAREIAREEEDF